MINATQIARLFGHTVSWGFRQIDAGKYGASVHLGGRSVWVPIAAVERHHGVSFSPEQLAAVGVEIAQLEEEAA